MQQELGSGPKQQEQQHVEQKAEFRDNARVRMQGLKAIQYNGRTGVLQKFNADEERWIVKLDNGTDTIRVKEANMVAHEAVEEAPPTKKQKVAKSDGARPKYEDLAANCFALASCFADAQIQYKADGKTQKSHPDSYQRYASYAKAKTLQEALLLGATSEDIVYDFNLGLLKIITLRHLAPQVSECSA